MALIKYTFADEPLRLPNGKTADAQEIGEALDRIRVDNGGELEPRAVVDHARDTTHPLHSFFEWDDLRAARSHRLDQARMLIRAVRIVDKQLGEPRAFISIRQESGVSYHSVNDVARNRDLAALVLAAAERDLEAFENRYSELKEICAIVYEARKKVQQKRSDRRGRGGRENRPNA